MSSPDITTRDQLKTLLGALAGFGGAGNVSGTRRTDEAGNDIFEKPGASVNLTRFQSDRGSMGGLTIRLQQFYIVLADTHPTDIESHLATLRDQFERDVEASRLADGFPTREIDLSAGEIDIAPDSANTQGLLTMVFDFHYDHSIAPAS